MRLIQITLCFLLFTMTLNAQISVTEDKGIRYMLDLRKEMNFKKDRYIKAWSVQVMVSRDKYEVLEKKESFLNDFKEEKFKVDWTYEQPNYKLNVGAYYTKLEATIALHKIIEKYPDAYVFKNNQAKASDF